VVSGAASVERPSLISAMEILRRSFGFECVGGAAAKRDRPR
jgi:hypothetical protein